MGSQHFGLEMCFSGSRMCFSGLRNVLFRSGKRPKMCFSGLGMRIEACFLMIESKQDALAGKAL